MSPFTPFSLPFYKGVALQNDFVILHRPELLSAFSQYSEGEPSPEFYFFLCHRRAGIGADQIVLYQSINGGEEEGPFSLESPRIPGYEKVYPRIVAQFSLPENLSPPPRYLVQFYNADGTEALACGNGSRALAHLLSTQNPSLPYPLFLFHTKGGPLFSYCLRKKELQKAPHPSFSQEISSFFPLPKFPNLFSHKEHGLLETLIGSSFSTTERENFFYQSKDFGSSRGRASSFYDIVDVGNLHLVIRVTNLDALPLSLLGPRLSQNALFPDQINVSFLQLNPDKSLSLKVWERGSGFTKACGTGACASAAVAFARGWASVHSPLLVHQEGGSLQVHQQPEAIEVIGSAEVSFQGYFNLSLWQKRIFYDPE